MCTASVKKTPCRPCQVTFIPRDKYGKIGGMALENLNEPLPSGMPSDLPVANLLHFANLRLITCEEVVDRARHGLLERLRDGAGGRTVDVRVRHI